MNGGDGKVLLWRRNHSHSTALKTLEFSWYSSKVPRRDNGFQRADSGLVNLNPLARYRRGLLAADSPSAHTPWVEWFRRSATTSASRLPRRRLIISLLRAP